MNFGVPKLSKLYIPKRVFVKNTQFGTKRLVTDTYRGLDWYALCRQVRLRDKGKCYKCQTSEDHSNGVWHDVHHIVPLSRGGLTVLINLVLLCKDCHNSKHLHMR